MSVQTITTNETNTVESASTLSFPNSSESEFTYNTNPSMITSEVNSNLTLVFPSEDGSNSTPMFESNETTSEDISNPTLVFPSENVPNSTPMFEFESNETTEDLLFLTIIVQLLIKLNFIKCMDSVWRNQVGKIVGLIKKWIAAYVTKLNGQKHLMFLVLIIKIIFYIIIILNQHKMMRQINHGGLLMRIILLVILYSL